ncbi:hypothetical protein D0T53_05500 [Dysgonomonas sp. 216]|uniref:hypothetical protein n=1 Tax=Dysgonomonas sp. 216 TaxID=2302934 RepID=UPI0013D7DEFC|nr:hypothetical protein [Dysgonomonas sp. 216]NDW18371.1 hypothetical protein [Dysgonomonas sp. 216]
MMSDTNKIKQLLEAFYEGETNVAQEQELCRYFTNGNIDPDLEDDKELFMQIYSSHYNENVPIPQGLEDRLGMLIDGLEELDKEKPARKKVGLWRWVSGVAAVLLIAILAGVYIQENTASNDKMLVDTYDEPEDAYKQTQSVLLEVSSKLNSGLGRLEEAEDSFIK